MENLNDKSYFYNDIFIPNLKDLLAFDTDYIAKYQKKYLLQRLGYAMYKDFETALAILPVENIPQKWLDLKNGVDYNVTINGVATLTRWNGFVNTEKISPITYYIYYWWVNSNNTQLTGVGVGQADKSNAVTISPKAKMVTAWNNYIELTGNIKNYIWNTAFHLFDKYSDSIYLREDLNFIDDSVKLDQSLFMYLYHHRDDFTNWVFKNDENTNKLGI